MQRIAVGKVGTQGHSHLQAHHTNLRIKRISITCHTHGPRQVLFCITDHLLQAPRGRKVPPAAALDMGDLGIHGHAILRW